MDRWKFFRRRPKAVACQRSKRECKIEMELRSIEAVVGALHAAGVRYLIVGGLAVLAHGYQRTTVDLIFGGAAFAAQSSSYTGGSRISWLPTPSSRFCRAIC